MLGSEGDMVGVRVQLSPAGASRGPNSGGGPGVSRLKDLCSPG